VLRHILDARQFTREWLEQELFPLTLRLEQAGNRGHTPSLVGRRLFYLFYEASTRTRLSFELAATALGATVHGIDSHEQAGEEEALEDRVRVLTEYGVDFLLLRYHEEGGAARAAAVSPVPVINAGDGAGQHPTQALLDVYTLWRELGRIDGLRVALVGDLSYQRSTNSLAYLLACYSGIRLYLVSPRLLRMQEHVRAYLVEHGVHVEEFRDLREIADDLDVVYVTRAQSARLQHAQRFESEAGANYAIDATVMDRLSPNARILHPLPRGLELPSQFDGDRRVACFRQAANGLYVRMGLLSLLASSDSLPA
jgi:aspartate carbamoyltransferase catalytic subunit